MDRQRPPRFIGKDGILRPYSYREATGFEWLQSVENGKYANEDYTCHLLLQMEDLAAVVTDQRVLMIHVRRLRVEWDLEYQGEPFCFLGSLF